MHSYILHIRIFTNLPYMGPTFIVPSEGLGTFYHIIPRDLCGCDDDGYWLQPGAFAKVVYSLHLTIAASALRTILTTLE